MKQKQYIHSNYALFFDQEYFLQIVSVLYEFLSRITVFRYNTAKSKWFSSFTPTIKVT